MSCTDSSNMQISKLIYCIWFFNWKIHHFFISFLKSFIPKHHWGKYLKKKQPLVSLLLSLAVVYDFWFQLFASLLKSWSCGLRSQSQLQFWHTHFFLHCGLCSIIHCLDAKHSVSGIVTSDYNFVPSFC